MPNEDVNPDDASEEQVTTASETLDDLVPEDILAHVAGALSDFPSISLPYEAEVVQAGEINRTNLSRCEAARIKSESIYGNSYAETEEEEREDGLYVTLTVLDPSEVVVDEEGEVVGYGEQ